ncbi:MAG: hypothetical protein RIS76_3211, partial [Verrucomicrobiota bacterium]
FIHPRNGSEVGPGWNRTLPVGWDCIPSTIVGRGVFHPRPHLDPPRVWRHPRGELAPGFRLWRGAVTSGS